MIISFSGYFQKNKNHLPKSCRQTTLCKPQWNFIIKKWKIRTWLFLWPVTEIIIYFISLIHVCICFWYILFFCDYDRIIPLKCRVRKINFPQKKLMHNFEKKYFFLLEGPSLNDNYINLWNSCVLITLCYYWSKS